MATEIRDQDGVTIIEPSGRIVGLAVSELRETISQQIEAADTPRILINFADVNQVDSGGLGALMEARALANQKQGRIGVINVGENIKNLLVLSRIVSQFEHFDNEDAAISELSA
ncbi:MAG: STAS domain-containing protein [Candidatus Poribacteria bacterium]|nr:STAS domain-containing protein [Candidatus Poribacteria bacterium]